MVSAEAPRAGESGMALALTLLMVAMVTMSVLVTAALLQSRTVSFRLEQREVVMTALTDAALAETVARLAEDQHFSGISDQEYGGGRVSSTVRRHSQLSFTVRASGSVPGWRSWVVAQVVRDLHGLKISSWKQSQGPE